MSTCEPLGITNYYPIHPRLVRDSTLGENTEIARGLPLVLFPELRLTRESSCFCVTSGICNFQQDCCHRTFKYVFPICSSRQGEVAAALPFRPNGSRRRATTLARFWLINNPVIYQLISSPSHASGSNCQPTRKRLCLDSGSVDPVQTASLPVALPCLCHFVPLISTLKGDSPSFLHHL